MRTRHTLGWEPTAHAKRLAALAALATVLGVTLGRPAVVALAAVPIIFLLLPRARRPAGCTMRVSVAARTCFEDEPVPVTIEVAADAPVELTRVEIRPARHVR